MPAAEKSQLDHPVRKLGIVAGGGEIPGRLLAACDRQGIETFVVAFDGQTDPLTVKGRNHVWTRLGAVGQALSALRSHDIRDLVLIGAVRRPSLSEMVPDLKTIEFFAKVGLRALGDNDFLGAIRKMLEEEGFALHGIQKFAGELLASEGPMGKYEPKKEDRAAIERGVDVSLKLGSADVGQSVIVQEGMVLGVEAAEGTDELIRRCKHLKRKGRGGVLVKLCKPGQDRDLDLPAIGSRTVELAAECGLAGIAIHAGNTLVIDPEEVARIADRHKIFVIGITI